MGIGDVVCLIYQKMGQSCPYQYTIVVGEPPCLIDPVPFPNPATEYVSLYTGLDEDFKCNIQNELGQTLLTHTFHSSIKINVEGWSNGIYYLSVYNSQSSNIFKIIKQ